MTGATCLVGAKPVGQKRILMVSQYSLFDQGLRAALSQQPGVEVVGVCRDLETACAQTQTLRPDVLLIIAEPEVIRDSAFRLLEEVSPCLIRISPTDGAMQVYRRQQVDQATLDDLMVVVQVASESLTASEDTESSQVASAE